MRSHTPPQGLAWLLRKPRKPLVCRAGVSPAPDAQERGPGKAGLLERGLWVRDEAIASVAEPRTSGRRRELPRRKEQSLPPSRGAGPPRRTGAAGLLGAELHSLGSGQGSFLSPGSSLLLRSPRRALGGALTTAFGRTSF